MNFSYHLRFLFLTFLELVLTQSVSVQGQITASDCPSSAMSRFQKHEVRSGETLETIAQQYKLSLNILLATNPGLNGKTPTVGSQVLITPYQGSVVQVPRGQTWKQTAAKYKIRADVLFEINGCQNNPTLVFIPKLNNELNRAMSRTLRAIATTTNNSSESVALVNLSGYPLPQEATIALPYGWQKSPKTGEVIFHSGVDLLTNLGNPVKSIGDGQVVFASQQGTYGKLVIINHSGGLQSRYAHLENIQVKVGEIIKQGDIVGKVGSTGQPTTTQPHLHFEVRLTSPQGWVAQDPKDYLKN
jgi:murein DD-endopeptidase MepM/ murein hydrolase activator NlpD